MSVSAVNSTASQPKFTPKQKVTAASIAGSAIGIASAVAGVYCMAKKGKPDLKLNKISYSEMEALAIGLGSVVGGLTGGLIADKDKRNIKPKLREASQQFIGNMMFPLCTLAIGNNLLNKANIVMPQIKSNNSVIKYINNIIKFIPKTATTIIALVGGMEIGNKVVNKLNNKIFKEEVKHDVKAEDYLVHADDICITANMLLKDVKSITSVTSTLLPLSFIVSGSKTGMQQMPFQTKEIKPDSDVFKDIIQPTEIKKA